MSFSQAKANEVRKKLREAASPAKAKVLTRFFKTGPGEYGEGDCFLGVTVPKTRKIVQSTKNISLTETQKLLCSSIHEERLAALFFLVREFQKAKDEKSRALVYRTYIRNLKHVNNWDLVDGSAPYIVGGFLLKKNKAQLYKWAKSKDLWKRRISIISTFAFIRKAQFQDTLKISRILLKDSHDLIHKAVGWMLREVGKKDLSSLESFLNQHYRDMPRTMLRYAIERLPEKKRKAYLKGTI